MNLKLMYCRRRETSEQQPASSGFWSKRKNIMIEIKKWTKPKKKQRRRKRLRGRRKESLRARRNGRQMTRDVCLLVGCLTSQQHASVSQGRICSDNFTCCHTEIEVADQTFHLTQSQYTDTGPTSPSADPITPGAWQGSHWSANF